MQVRVPLFYREVLSRQYGNYMKIPDHVEAMNGRSHGSVTLDPDTPFSDFFAARGRQDGAESELGR